MQRPITVGKGRYTLLQRINSGSFGDVFLGKDNLSDEKIAVKLEHQCIKHPQLAYECMVYRALTGGEGIPLVRHFSVEGLYRAMVLDLLGYNLEELFVFCNHRFSVPTTFALGKLMLARLQFLHQKGFIHRDVKPTNFMMGTGADSDCLYLVDYGLSKRYIDKRTGQHIPLKHGREPIGTMRYASLNMHRGTEQSRRDDLESLAYSMIYLLKGKLPWQNQNHLKDKKARDRLIVDIKSNLQIDKLCEFLPPQMHLFLIYTRSLGFDAEPNYDYIRSLFNLVLQSGSARYDWIELHSPPTQTAPSSTPTRDPDPAAMNKQSTEDREQDEDCDNHGETKSQDEFTPGLNAIDQLFET
jgi:serine/threonine protein kinase